MTFQTFTWHPETDTTGREQYRVMTAQFGDGYKQTAGDGIHTAVQSWPVQFAGNAAQIAPIRDFLRTHGGITPFWWTPPLGVPALFDADKLTVQAKGHDWFVLSTTFTQRFTP